MNDEWETPDDLFAVLDSEFDFDFDLCANENNAKCQSWTSDIGAFYSGLTEEPLDVFWMNPPYSKPKITECMRIASEIGKTKEVVCLVRFDPSAKWFQKYVDGVAAEVRMLDRRIKFKGAKDSYNFPCCLAIYYPHINHATDYYMWGWK